MFYINEKADFMFSNAQRLAIKIETIQMALFYTAQPSAVFLFLEGGRIQAAQSNDEAEARNMLKNLAEEFTDSLICENEVASLFIINNRVIDCLSVQLDQAGIKRDLSIQLAGSVQPITIGYRRPIEANFIFGEICDYLEIPSDIETGKSTGLLLDQHGR